jgi:hypothetical protein
MAHGKPIRRSTKQTTKARAMEVAAEFLKQVSRMMGHTDLATTNRYSTTKQMG